MANQSMGMLLPLFRWKTDLNFRPKQISGEYPHAFDFGDANTLSLPFSDAFRDSAEIIWPTHAST